MTYTVLLITVFLVSGRLLFDSTVMLFLLWYIVDTLGYYTYTSRYLMALLVYRTISLLGPILARICSFWYDLARDLFRDVKEGVEYISINHVTLAAIYMIMLLYSLPRIIWLRRFLVTHLYAMDH